MTQLTKHFTLSEMTHSNKALELGIDNKPSGEEQDNLKDLCEVLEKVRTILGGDAILVSSGFRNERVNQAVGGVWNSAHLHGLAADFTCPSFGTVKEVCEAIAPHVEKLGIDQLIYEYGGWVHLGIAQKQPRHQVFTLNKTGQHTGIV